MRENLPQNCVMNEDVAAFFQGLDFCKTRAAQKEKNHNYETVEKNQGITT